MKLWHKIFVNLHFNSKTRRCWRERLGYDWGKRGNHVYWVCQGKRKECFSIIKGLAIRIQGENNIIEIGEGSLFSESELLIEGNHNQVVFGFNVFHAHMMVTIPDSGRKFVVGDRSTSVGVRCFLHEKDLLIGKDCMFSDSIEIMTSDSHQILDKQTGEQLNAKPGQLTIGDHVWIGRRAFVTKNAQIPSGCIVGASSVVTKPFTQPDCILAGFPAKVIKTGITWKGDLPTISQ